MDLEENLPSVSPLFILHQKLTSDISLGSLMEKNYQFMTAGTF